MNSFEEQSKTKVAQRNVLNIYAFLIFSLGSQERSSRVGP